MRKSYIQKAALNYARSIEPLDPEMGWRREDVQLAFMAGAEAPPVARLMSLRDVADALAVSVSTVNDLVRFGELAYVHAGRGTERKRLTFRPEEIENFLKRHTQRDCHDPSPKTARYATRKRAHELAVEQSVAGGNDFFAQRAARLAAAKPKQKK